MKQSKNMSTQILPIANFNTTIKFEYEFEIPELLAFSDLLYSQTIKKSHELSIKVFIGGRRYERPKLVIPIVIGPATSYVKENGLNDYSQQDFDYLVSIKENLN